MFCFLQTLHLIPYSSFPTASFLIPFSESSLIRRPTFPTEFSRAGFGQLASELFVGPFAIAATYTFLRWFIEDRIYRIIRRQLPKQGRPDELSIQVAVDNGLLEWTVPAAGRHMEYETYRGNLSVLEDVKEEFRELIKQVSNWLGWNQESSSDIKSSSSTARNAAETARNRNRNYFEEEQQEMDGAMSSTPVQSAFDTNQGQILANEQLTQSPAQITPISLDGLRPVGRTGADSNIRQDGAETSWLPFQDSEQRSRTNTLFSRPASPESPLTSPRIRASLTHQNPFTTTMEISLQSSRNIQRIEQVDADVANLDTATSLDELNIQSFRLDSLTLLDEVRILESTPTEREAGEAEERNGIEDSPAEDESHLTPTHLVGVMNPTELREPISNERREEVGEGRERDGIDGPAAEIPNVSGATHPPENPDHDADDILGGLSDENTLIPAMPAAAAQLTVLPDTVEEPLHSPTRQENMDAISEAGTQDLQPRSLPRDRSQQRGSSGPIQQRVTVLSAFPMDGLAHMLASMFSTVLFVPFRSVFHRSLAIAYLSTPAAAVFSRNIAVSASDVRGVNAFAGGGNPHDMITYVGKVAMVIGLQTALSGSILSMSSTAAIRIGKRMFGWGQL
ncbi:hypothetical protein PISL3812_05007 [Talaromyces islandicus]|uniref:Uncharacterized protein n=1 Tax=Talaromyces islandicus TaxID=28573 RepID=A0A0U1LXH2_TALIS|nr:hypothetical protein PISL3812_05007 [Talaromyces islandicus]